jgi:uncharacterized protein (DUF433 family)
MNPLLERITINPSICAGKPCIKGTRIWVSLILDFLADDMTEAELLAEYPGLTHEDVLAAIAYGAEAARERVIPILIEHGNPGARREAGLRANSRAELIAQLVLPGEAAIFVTTAYSRSGKWLQKASLPFEYRLSFKTAGCNRRGHRPAEIMGLQPGARGVRRVEDLANRGDKTWSGGGRRRRIRNRCRG